MIRIASVSYTNSYPFVYGLNHYPFSESVGISKAIPSALIAMLKNNECDVALLPIGALTHLVQYHFVTSFGIASDDHVASVCIFSQLPLEQIDYLYLDYQSMSSVALSKILLEQYWKFKPVFLETVDDSYFEKISENYAGVVIGDRALELKDKFAYCYDLAGIWKQFTGLPFVFARWVSIKPLPENFEIEFSQALQYGIDHILQVIDHYHLSNSVYDIHTYYNTNINYTLNHQHEKSINLFLDYINQKR